MKLKLILFTVLLLVTTMTVAGQSTPPFTHADSLRGSVTSERAWWDVTFYDLHLAIHPEDSTITGWNAITYEVTDEAKEMQIDLQPPLKIDSVKQGGESLQYRRDGNAYFVTLEASQPVDTHKTISVYYSGHPHIAENPPWSGGFTWTTDEEGNPWIVTTAQGIGASIWWPNKDHQSEEPDSMGITLTVPDRLTAVANGRLRNTTHNSNDGTSTYSWFVNNPINNYGVSISVGQYTHFNGSYEGEKGTLDIDYWILEYNLEKAKNYLPEQAKNVLEAFEYWFGPYPFYEDSYKLVDVPNTGMEHQSGIGYGNQYAHGYRGNSSSPWGLKFDFIVMHESAHEWWGNNITTRDIANMWVHEGFGSYAGSLFVEYMFGKEAGAEHVTSGRGFSNEHPIISHYNVNEKPPGDMYGKGANLLHTIRQIIDNDEQWREILRGLNQEFWHQVVTSTDVENYISQHSGKDLSKIFDQYLRHADIPDFQYYIKDSTLYYRWNADVEGFDMPIKVMLDEGEYAFITPVTGEWKTDSLNLKSPKNFKIDENFYVNTVYAQPENLTSTTY